MMKIKKYELEFELAKSYLIDKVGDVNILSKLVCETIDFSLGTFYTFFPETEEALRVINNFRGSLTRPASHDFFYSFVTNYLKENPSRTCIFDDFEQQYNPDYHEELFLTHGVHLNQEIYYLFSKKNISLEKLTTAFKYCDILWRSLTIITSTSIDVNTDKTLTKNDCINICKHAELILVTAYDGLGYICWERNKY